MVNFSPACSAAGFVTQAVLSSQLSQLHSSQHQFKDNLVAARWITAPAVNSKGRTALTLKHHHHHPPHCKALWKMLFVTSQWEWEDSTLLFFPMQKKQSVYFPAGSLAVAGRHPVIKLGSSYHLPCWRTKPCMSDSTSVFYNCAVPVMSLGITR